MPDQSLQTCSYRILRYTPNLVRDEWVNIGVVLLDAAQPRAAVRLIEEPAEFARVRKLHPQVDHELLQALRDDFEKQFAGPNGDPGAVLARLDDTLSNLLQFSPARGVLTEDFEGELDRLYRDHVEPPRPRARAAAEVASRHGIRVRISQVFHSAGLLPRMQRGVRVDEFTYKGDPLRLDFSYRRNGTQGFVHAVALAGDPAHAKVLSFTAARIRTRLTSTEFAAVTEAEPHPGNDRHAFISGLLQEQGIALYALARLPDFASRLRAEIRD